MQCSLKQDYFKNCATCEKSIWSSSGKVNSCFTFKLQIGCLFVSIFLCLFLGPQPSRWSRRSRWPRSGWVQLSRKRGIIVDLICCWTWTHKRPQLDLGLPHHTITEEPNVVISYIKEFSKKEVFTIIQLLTSTWDSLQRQIVSTRCLLTKMRHV